MASGIAKVALPPEVEALGSLTVENNVKKMIELLIRDERKAKPSITIEAARAAAVKKLEPFYTAINEADVDALGNQAGKAEKVNPALLRTVQSKTKNINLRALADQVS